MLDDLSACFVLMLPHLPWKDMLELCNIVQNWLSMHSVPDRIIIIESICRDGADTPIKP